MGVSVTENRGAASVVLPLPGLPARAGFGPGLALTYSTSPTDARDGFGIGFSLGSSSVGIAGDWGVPYRYVTANGDLAARLTLNGARLERVRTEKVNGALSIIEYRLDGTDSLVRVFRHMPGAEMAVPDRQGGTLALAGFRVVYPDGRQEYYSEAPEVAEGLMLKRFFATRWPLVAAVSPTGEVVTYQYDKPTEDQRSYLSSVSFAGGRSAYVFERAERPRAPTDYVMGSPQKAGHLYTKMTARFDGELMYQWCFVYGVYAQDGAKLLTHPDCAAVAQEDFAAELTKLSASLSRQDKLLGVYRFGRSAVPLTRNTQQEPLVRFQYSGWTISDIRDHSLVYDIEIPDVYGFGPEGGSEFLDLNADGLADVLRASLSDNRSFASYNLGDLARQNPFVQRDGVVLQKVLGGIEQPEVLRFDERPGSDSLFWTGDFNGDGLTDVVHITASGGQSELFFFRGQQGVPGKPFAAATRSSMLDAYVGQLMHGRSRVIDLNADGKDDILIATTDGVTATWTAHVNITSPEDRALSFQTLTNLRFPFTAGAGWELDNPAYRFLDVNGDGLQDLAVLKVTGAGEKGLCVYENQGGVWAYTYTSLGTDSQGRDVPRGRMAAGAMVFGFDAGDPVCEQGFFLPAQGIESGVNLNAMWLADVNGDGNIDLAHLTATANALKVWFGQGRDGFSRAELIPLNTTLSVDTQNIWNTRVIDIDGDGVGEILVYEPTPQGGRLRVIDFNRTGQKNVVGPDLLVAASEGTGLRHAFVYGTTTDELVRDRRQLGMDDASLRGLPYALPVVKRHALLVGGEPPQLTAFRYHAPHFESEARSFVGFARSDMLTLGDSTQPDLGIRRTYAVQGTRTDRFLASMTRMEELVRPTPLRVRPAVPGPLETASAVSFTAETWSEEPLTPAAVLSQQESDWAVEPLPEAEARTPPVFVRLLSTRSRSCSESSGCVAPATSTRTLDYDALNRLVREQEALNAVAGPEDLQVPSHASVRTLTYDPVWEERGILTAVSGEVVKTLPSGAVLSKTTTVYAEQWPLPVRVTAQGETDPEALSGLDTRFTQAIQKSAVRTLTHAYDAFGNVVESGDGLGITARFIYDPTGLRIVESRNSLGHRTRYCYGSAECTLGGTGEGIPERSLARTHLLTPQGELTVSRFDSLHRPVRMTDSSGREVAYAYRDAEGTQPRLVRVIERRAATGLRMTTERLFAFRADGRSLGEAIESESTGARVLAYATYNATGAPVFSAQPYLEAQGPAALFAEGRFPAPASAPGCGLGLGTCTSYDALGRPVEVTDSSGRYVVRTVYEPWGRRLEERLTESGGAVVRTSTSVERSGEVYALVDEAGQIYRYSRDAHGRLYRIHLPGEETPRRVVFDADGDLLLSQASGIMTRLWTRDTRGRVTQGMTWSASGSEWERVERTYDALNRLTHLRASSSVYPDGTDDLSFVYDKREGQPATPETLDRLVEASAHDLLGAQHVTEHYTYDRSGQRTGHMLSYSGGGVERTYEEAWTYALDGKLASYDDPFGNTFTLERHGAGALAAIHWSAPGRVEAPLIAGIQYNGRGQITAYTAPRMGLERQYGYETASGRLVHLQACITREAGCVPVQDMLLTHRADGRISAIQDGSRTSSYTYSPRGELLSAQEGGQTQTYAYGPSGEPSRLSEGADYLFERASGTNAIPLPKGGNFRLDVFGRVVAGGAMREIIYDPFGRIRRIELDGKTLIYGYSVAGDRVSKQVRVKEGAQEKVSEVVIYPSRFTRDNGRERQSLVRIEGRRLALIVDEQRVFTLLDDSRGVVRALVDESGQTPLQAEYTPFGLATVTGAQNLLESTELVFSFTGRFTDPDTGLIQMGAREYAPGLASFTTPDAYVFSEPEFCVGSPLECHLYTYARHDPINFSDESGLMTQSVGSTFQTRHPNNPQGGVSGRFTVHVYEAFRRQAQPAAGEHYQVGANIKIGFAATNHEMKIGLVQFKSPLNWQGTAHERVHPAMQPGGNYPANRMGWAVDRGNSRRNPVYGMSDSDAPEPLLEGMLGADSLARETLKARYGERGNEATLIDTPRELARFPEAARSTFITVALDMNSGQYLGAVRWGYDVNAAGEVALLKPKLIHGSGLPDLLHGALEQWNNQRHAGNAMNIQLPHP
ncbi:FG-GAP-like repeat-containing protein [Vitiosangium sp. GDMCC 1.1324]|uniref:FG-GAP-like repeat-containing protein n=1 Tax=Vitiosangium sp. (strain GDMCC 1.1324) TaxID=2138576 RepID=UPI00130E48F8|nr:FG-GAP-like repeat-containing protein [Vitiosangium sp. GDMCC 1.1324]